MSRLTQPEKRITLALIVISAALVLVLFVGVPEGPVPLGYVIGSFVLVIATETYVFFSFVSNRFKNRFVYASLQINGASDRN